MEGWPNLYPTANMASFHTLAKFSKEVKSIFLMTWIRKLTFWHEQLMHLRKGGSYFRSSESIPTFWDLDMSKLICFLYHKANAYTNMQALLQYLNGGMIWADGESNSALCVLQDWYSIWFGDIHQGSVVYTQDLITNSQVTLLKRNYNYISMKTSVKVDVLHLCSLYKPLTQKWKCANIFCVCVC